jgi:N-acylneuraminate cytidylyltransferase
MNNIAIIIARGGSKRIPRKNIKDFYGKPLISYSINAALNSKVFSKVLVSTDDKEIAEVSRRCGAEVPFFRSSINANDFATTEDVILEVLDRLKKYGIIFDSFCCIYPTAPFLTGVKLKNSYEKFYSTNANTLFSICKFSYPIQRGLRQKGGFVEMLFPENENKRSQDLEPVFHDAGQFYWGRINYFLQKKKLFGTMAVGFELSELEVQDIDTETDWEIAEIKYQKIYGEK